MSKRLGILAVLAAITVVVFIATNGGSTDHSANHTTNHSSEWNSTQASTIESEATLVAPELTSEGIACLMGRYKAAFSPSEVFLPSGEQNANFYNSHKDMVDGIVNKCVEVPSNIVQGLLGEICHKQGILSERCLEEVTNHMGEAKEAAEEEYTP